MMGYCGFNIEPVYSDVCDITDAPKLQQRYVET